MALTKKQLAAIHVGKKALGLSDGAYRAALERLTGATSASMLEPAEFEMVIEHFMALGWRPRFRREFYGHRPGMASPAQLTFIRALWGEYTGDEGTDRTLGKWLYRTFGVSAPRFLAAELAPKAITALKAMKAKRAGAKSAPPPERQAERHGMTR